MKKAFYAPMLLLSVFCFFCSTADAEITSRFKATGQAGFSKDVFKFKSAIARWKAAEKVLEVGFFPFEVTEEDAQTVEQTQMMFYATAGKRSPNPAKWASPPYIIVMIKFKGDRDQYTVNDISDYGLNVVKVKGASTIGVFLQENDAKEIIKAFQFSPRKLGALKLEVNETKDRDQMVNFRYKAKITGK